jgi:hypothetical protein
MNNQFLLLLAATLLFPVFFLGCNLPYSAKPGDPPVDPGVLSSAVYKINFSSSRQQNLPLAGLDKQNIYLVQVNRSSATVPSANIGYASSQNERAILPEPLPRMAENVSGIFKAADGATLTRCENPEIAAFNRNPPPISLQNARSAIPDPLAAEYAVDFSSKSFWVQAKDGSWQQIPAVLRGTGDHANVWVAEANYDASGRTSQTDNKITSAQARSLASKFDTIYEKETPLFGYEYGGGLDASDKTYGGVDGDPKIQVLVYDIDYDYEPEQKNGTFGFFWAKDCYSQAQLSHSIKSNHAEMFYVDALFTDKFPEGAYSTLAHEFQHMINFNQKFVKHGKSSSVWFSEMLAMLAEDVIDGFLGIPITNGEHPVALRVPPFLAQYNSADFEIWDKSLTSYATVYAFGAYLARNFGGAGLVQRMMANGLVDEASITNALSSSANPLNASISTFAQAVIRYGEAFIFSGSHKPENAFSFDNTVTTNINGTDYTFTGFDIWAMNNPFAGTSYASDKNGKQFYCPEKGPLVIDTTLITDMPGHSVLVQSCEDWQNKTGTLSITVVKPASSSIEFYIMVR